MNAMTYLIESVLDEFFTHARGSAEVLAGMQGKVIALEIGGDEANGSSGSSGSGRLGGLSLFFRPVGDGVRVDTQWDGAVDVRIAGSAFDLYQLATHTSRSGSGVHVDISGDVDLGQQFTEMFTASDVSLADMLSGVVGRPAAHWLEARAGDCARVGGRVLDTLAHSAGDYLREEARVTPDPLEIKYFVEQVDRLRDACAQFEARLRKQNDRNDRNDREGAS